MYIYIYIYTYIHIKVPDCFLAGDCCSSVAGAAGVLREITSGRLVLTCLIVFVLVILLLLLLLDYYHYHYLLLTVLRYYSDYHYTTVNTDSPPREVVEVLSRSPKLRGSRRASVYINIEYIIIELPPYDYMYTSVYLMYIIVCTYIHIYIYIHIDTYIYIYIYTHIHIHIHEYINILCIPKSCEARGSRQGGGPRRGLDIIAAIIVDRSN